MLTHLAIAVAICDRACDWPRCLRTWQSSSRSAIVLTIGRNACALGNLRRDLRSCLRLAKMLTHLAFAICQDGFESLSLCRHKTKGHPLRREAAARKTYETGPTRRDYQGAFYHRWQKHPRTPKSPRNSRFSYSVFHISPTCARPAKTIGRKCALFS